MLFLNLLILVEPWRGVRLAVLGVRDDGFSVMVFYYFITGSDMPAKNSYHSLKLTFMSPVWSILLMMPSSFPFYS